jgi:transcriptional regulator with XRE-family HTH domain
MKIKKVNELLHEDLKNPYFKELWELEEQKLEMVKPIIEYRVKNNLTQGELAKQIKVSQQHISNIESGEFSSVATLEKVLLFIGYKVKMEAIPLTRNIKNRILKSLRSNKKIQMA